MDTILIEDHRTLQAILGKFSVFVCFFLGKQNEKFFSRIQKMRKVSSNRKKNSKNVMTLRQSTTTLNLLLLFFFKKKEILCTCFLTQT